MESVSPATQDRPHSVEDCVRGLLVHLGEDIDREGLVDTPGRVAKALREMTAGQHEDPGAILSRTFRVHCDEMVIVTGIAFTSLCEHHMLPFTGTVDIGYVPSGCVVGLSKLPRLVDCYSRRLQVQERMTEQIAEAIDEHLEPLGVAVIVSGAHSCMSCRGVRKPGAKMLTSAMRGIMRDDSKARSEFLALRGK